jgi:hypothetical protein
MKKVRIVLQAAPTLLVFALFGFGSAQLQPPDWNTLMQNYGPQLQASHQRFVQYSGLPVPFEDYVMFLLTYQQQLSAGYGAFVQQQGPVPFEAFLVYVVAANRAAQPYAPQPYDPNQPHPSSSPDSATVENFGLYIRGNGYYLDPNTGQTVELPYAPDAGTSYDVDGMPFSMDGSGSYINPTGDTLTPTDPSAGE